MFPKKQKTPKKPRDFSGTILNGIIIAFLLYFIYQGFPNVSYTVSTPVKNSPKAASYIQNALPELPHTLAQKTPQQPSPESDSIKITILKPGQDVSARCGDTVKLIYKAFGKDGNIITDHMLSPATFQIGSNSQPFGLEYGSIGVQTGESRQIETHHQGKTTNFVIQILDVSSTRSLNFSSDQQMPFRSFDLDEGVGEPAICGDKVQVRCTFYGADGMAIESSENITWQLGTSPHPLLFYDMVAGTRIGGTRYSILPPALLRQLGTELPTNQVIHVETTLLTIKKPEFPPLKIMPTLEPLPFPEEERGAPVEKKDVILNEGKDLTPQGDSSALPQNDKIK